MNKNLKKASRMQTAETLAEHLSHLHSVDAIDAVNVLGLNKKVAVIEKLPLAFAIELFDKPELQMPAQILQALSPERASAILDGMSADEAADVFQEMDIEARKKLFALLLPLTRAEVQKLAAYPSDTAGALMTTEFIAVPADWTVKQALDHIRAVERTRETVYASYVIDPRNSTLLKAVSLRMMVLADPTDNILDIAKDVNPITISALTDREDVARLFRRYDLLSVPVVDDTNHVIGIVTVDDVLDAIVEESSEDAHKFGGMEALDKPYMQIGLFDMLKKRGGWLAVLFLGELLTASVMQHFEDELEKAIVLTLFIPLIMSSGGNSGSQATSLIIRALALGEIKLSDWWKVIKRELPTGLALGGMLGTLGFVRVILWQQLSIYDYGEHWLLIALTIFATLIGIVAFGSIVGSMLPFILKRFGFDPASASAPFVATLVDVSGIAIYFSIAAAILTGTLL